MKNSEALVYRVEFSYRATAHDLTIVRFPDDLIVVSDHRSNPAWSAALPLDCWEDCNASYLAEKLGCPTIDAAAIALAVNQALVSCN